MFEKWTKKIASKSTDSAIEGAKQTLNDRLDKYSDIIVIGLIIGVIAFGGNKLINGNKKKETNNQLYLPQGQAQGSPIVINNYISDPYERNPYRNAAKGGYKQWKKTEKK